MTDARFIFIILNVFAMIAFAQSREMVRIESDVTFAAGGIELNGTLLIPRTPHAATYPGVLLLPGSGPTDRNGNQPPMLTTDLLKQFAEHLADNGIASFRFDKRAAHVNVKQWPSGIGNQNEFFGLDGFIADAQAALKCLGNHQKVDADRLAILGHSEGGLIALNVVHRLGTEAPPALILAATAAQDYRGLLRHQIGGALDRQGSGSDTKAEYLTALEDAMQCVLDGKPVPRDLPAGLRMLFPANAMKLLKDYFTIDPVELAADYAGHVLAIHGEKDIQIPVTHSTDIFRNAFNSRGHGTFHAVSIPNASHNLKPLKGPADPGFVGPADERALNGLTDWLRELDWTVEPIE